MSFIVPLMAFGAAAALIPIIIHLLNRSRYRIVPWGAMHLLDSVIRVNRRRIRIEQLILLAVRASIPACIALFMAKPVLTGWKALPGDVKRSVVIALDNSYSMEAGGGDQSNFAKAKRAVGEILGGLRRGSDAAVVTMAGGADPSFEKPTVGLRTLRAAVRNLGGGFGIADAGGSLDTALGLFASMDHADRELVVASDFQRVSWGGEQATEVRRCAAAIAALPVKPRIVLFRAGPAPDENVCIESLTFSKFIVGVGQKFQVKAVVKNYGEKHYTGLRVHFRVDGAERETSEIAVGPGERAQVIFAHAFESAGSHVVEAAADADPLTADNALLAAIPVWDTIPVLLVSGQVSAEALRGETDYLEVALGPFAAGGAQLVDLLRPRVVEETKLDARALADARVVVLANVAALATAQVAALEDFVRSGGGLLIFPGDRCDIPWYNAALVKGGEGLLPLGLRGVAGSATERAKQTSIVGERFEHEALALFNVPQNGTIAGGEVWMWCPLENAPAAGGSAGRVTTLASLANGDPFLAEWNFGEGRVIYCATACDADWGNLPVRPFYVPLVQQLVTYLASTVYPPRNVSVGKELSLFLPAAKAGAKLMVTLPDRTVRTIEAVDKGARAVAAFTETGRPGLYVMQGEGIEPVHFVVDTSRLESALEELTEAELAETAAALGADIVASSSEYDALQAERRHGREIWRQLFWAAVSCLFLELLLERFFARRKR